MQYLPVLIFQSYKHIEITLFRTNTTQNKALPANKALPPTPPQQGGERYAMHLYSSGGLRPPQQSTPSSLTYWERGRPRPRKN